MRIAIVTGASSDSLDRAEPNAESGTARDQQPTDQRR
jgi:hypothetical protein